MRGIVIRVLFAVLAAVCPAMAQLHWGSVRGVVSDLSGAVIPSAQVTASNRSLPRGLTLVTDSYGRYVYGALPVGTYTISVAAPGFRTLRYHDIEVRLGAQVTFNARLAPGSVTETVEVNESLSRLDTASSQTATTITATEFDNVARGRSFHTLLMMAPGVRHEAKSGSTGVGGITVDGASGSENTYYVDGVEVSDVLTGALRSQNSLPVEFVRQIQVKSGGFEAEFGGATGGVINVATRGGSNEVHGELQMQLMAGLLNSSDRGFWQRSAANPDQAEFIKPKKDDYRVLYPGFSIGGPVLPGRIFGLLSYMPELEHTARTIAYPDSARRFEQDRTRHYSLSRVDVALRNDLQLNASWVWSPVERNGLLPVRDPRIRAPLAALAANEYTPAQTLSLSGNYTLDSRTLISARYGYKYLNGRTGNYNVSSLPFVTYRTPSSVVPGVPAELAGASGFSTTAGAFVVDRDITTRNNLYVDGSRVANLFGQQHVFKAGYMLNGLYNEVVDGYANGRFDVYWGETFSRAGVAADSGRYGYYIWEDGPRHNSRAAGRNHGLYAQDTWRILPTVTINAGLRLEKEFVPPYRQEFNGRRVSNPVSFGWGDKVAPRLGAAWDIRGDGKWKLSGSYGMFYDLMKYAMARAAFGGSSWVSHVFRLDDPDVRRLSLANPEALGQKIATYDNRSIPVDGDGNWSGIDPDLKPFTSREFTVALERQVLPRLNASVRYTNKSLLRAIEDIGVLDEQGSEVYLIGNPGFGLTRNSNSVYGARTPDGQEFLFPRATRRYDALEARVEGDLAGFHLLGSYTFSRLYGNYSGLANSDEAGRMEPSISRSFDLPTYYFDASGRQRNIEGRLATDRPHVTKLFVWREAPNRFGSTSVGLTQLAMSGTLDSTTVTYLSAPTFPNGRGDLGRTPFLTQTDLNLTHSFRLTERWTLKLEAVGTNVLNQAAATSRATQINRTGNLTAVQMPLTRFFQPWNVTDYVYPGSTTPAYNPVYGLPGGDPVDGGVGMKAGRSDYSSAFLAQNPAFGAYQGPRTFRLGLRLIF